MQVRVPGLVDAPEWHGGLSDVRGIAPHEDAPQATTVEGHVEIIENKPLFALWLIVHPALVIAFMRMDGHGHTWGDIAFWCGGQMLVVLAFVAAVWATERWGD